MILPYTPDLLLFTPDLLFRLREYQQVAPAAYWDGCPPGSDARAHSYLQPDHHEEQGHESRQI